MNENEEQQQSVDNSQQSVDNSQQSVDNSQQSVDNSDNPVDNSQQSVDNSDNPVDNSDNPVDNFNPQDYLKSLEPDEDKPDMQSVLQENALLKKQLSTVKDAYINLKKTGVTVLSNPDTPNQYQAPTGDETTQKADAMLKKYLHG